MFIMLFRFHKMPELGEAAVDQRGAEGRAQSPLLPQGPSAQTFGSVFVLVPRTGSLWASVL